jgi:hypothetical protein
MSRSLEQMLADWIRKAWLNDHPEAPPLEAWPMEVARDLARQVRLNFTVKAR